MTIWMCLKKRLQSWSTASCRKWNKGKMLDIFKSYAKVSSAHGLARLARSKSYVERVFWALVCLSALGLFFGQGTVLLQRYYSYPSSVQIGIGNNPVPFPAVSICNLRPLDVYTLGDVVFNGSDFWRWDIGEDWDYDGRTNSSVPLFERSIIQFGNYYRAYRAFAANEAKLTGDDQFLWDADLKLLSRLTVAANLENSTAAFQGGIQKEELIAFCNYQGDQCTFANFSWFLDTGYLNCYTFDLSEAPKEYRTVIGGPGHGLALVLFVPTISIMKYREEVSSWLALNHEVTLGGEGVRVVVHQPNTVPFPLTDGLDVPRGVSASVGVTLTQYSRLDPPHGNCTNSKNLEGFQNYTYTQATCQRYCLQKLVVKICNCTDPSLPLPPDDQDIPMCSTFDVLPDECTPPGLYKNFESCDLIFRKWFDRMHCMQETRSNVSLSLVALEKCQCAPTCEETQYHLFYSLSDWPMEEQAENLVRDILHVEGFIDRFPPEKAERYFGDVDARTQTPTFATYRKFVEDKNLLRLTVYISDSSVLHIMETEAYTLTQLASDVGGLLSLWIGVSIITLVEMTELILSLIQQCCKSRRENGEKEKARKHNSVDALENTSTSSTVQITECTSEF